MAIYTPGPVLVRMAVDLVRGPQEPNVAHVHPDGPPDLDHVQPNGLDLRQVPVHLTRARREVRLC